MHKGYGNCKTSWSFGGKTGPICWVNQPSVCTDKTRHSFGEYSWEACLKKGNIHTPLF